MLLLLIQIIIILIRKIERSIRLIFIIRFKPFIVIKFIRKKEIIIIKALKIKVLTKRIIIILILKFILLFIRIRR